MRNHLALACLVLGACSDSSVDSNEQARRAYLGLDKSVSKSLQLGFDGYNAATNANIPTQMMAGDAKGTIAIGGKVDAGTSTNKVMTLSVGMVTYSDGPFVVDTKNNTKITVVYDTSTTLADQPVLSLKLMNIPNGTLSGTLTGTYTMSGDLTGDVTLDLTLTGALMSGPNNTTVRVPGGTTVTGTAMSHNGTYDVNLTL